MPASVKEAMKDGPPRSPKWREQMVSATSKMAPSPYTLHAGVIFTLAILPCRLELCRHKLLPGASPYKALIPHAFVTPVQFDRLLALFLKRSWTWNLINA